MTEKNTGTYHRGPKRSWFITSYLLAAGAACFPATLSLIVNLPAGVYFLWLFPTGLYRCLGLSVGWSERPDISILSHLLALAGLLIYISLAHLGIKRVSMKLFWVFIVLLLINIGGCQISMREGMRHIHGSF